MKNCIKLKYLLIVFCFLNKCTLKGKDSKYITHGIQRTKEGQNIATKTYKPWETSIYNT